MVSLTYPFSPIYNCVQCLYPDSLIVMCPILVRNSPLPDFRIIFLIIQMGISMGFGIRHQLLIRHITKGCMIRSRAGVIMKPAISNVHKIPIMHLTIRKLLDIHIFDSCNRQKLFCHAGIDIAISLASGQAFIGRFSPSIFLPIRHICDVSLYPLVD